MLSTIFVAPASGITGRLVARALVRRGVRVRAGIRSAIKARALPAGAHPVAVDLGDIDSLLPALAQCEAVYLAPPLSPDMIAMTANVVRAARDAGVRRLVRLSEAGSEAERPIQVAAWHREAERVVEESDLEWTFLRTGSLMQNFAELSGHPIRAQSLFFDAVGPAGPVAHVDARDLADAAATVLTTDGHGGRCYTLTGPEPVTNATAATVLSRFVGREVHYVEVTPAALMACMRAHGVAEPLAEAILELQTAMRDGRLAGVTGDVQAVTGRPPRAFAEFVRDHAHAFA